MSRLRAAATALALTGSVLVGVQGAAAAPVAASRLCERYGATPTEDGRYIVQNNRWGSGARQCIDVTRNGFVLTTSEADNPTDGAPASYPSIYWGCHYGACTPGFSPVRASSATFERIRTSVATTRRDSGSWNASYDIWFDPTPRRDGQNTGAEVMVWLDHSGPPQPIGTQVGTVRLLGATWDVWAGNIGWNVVSYVRRSPTGSIEFPVSAFFDDVVSRGYAERSWYLTSVQAGFEPWKDGASLAVTDFSAGVDDTPVQPEPDPSRPAPEPTPVRPAPAPLQPAPDPEDDERLENRPTRTTSTEVTTDRPAPAPTRTAGPGAGPGDCTASYAVDGSWPGGLVATVTVTNTGPAPTSSWQVDVELPEGQRVANLWNGSSRDTAGTLAVRSADYNGRLAPGASTTFGLQVTTDGDGAEPAAVTGRCRG